MGYVIGVRERVRQLRTLAALPKDQSSVPGPTLGSCEPPIAPSAELPLLASVGTCTHRDTHTQTNKIFMGLER